MRCWWIGALGLVCAQKGLYFTDIQKALHEARKQKKPLWVMVSATWCGPCKLVEQHFLPDLQVQAFLWRHFVPLKVYAASGEANTPGADSLASRYSVKVFPTFLVLEPSGKLFHRFQGTPTEKALFVKLLEKQQRAWKDLPGYAKRFRQGERELEFLRAYLRLVVEIEDTAAFPAVFAAYRQAAPSFRTAWLGEPGYYKLLAQMPAFGEPYVRYALSLVDSLRPFVPSEELAELAGQNAIFFLQGFMKRPPTTSAEWDSLERAMRALTRQVPEAQKRLLERVALPVAKRALGTATPTERPAIERRLFAWIAQLAAQAVGTEIPEASRREALAYELNTLAWTCYEAIEAPELLWAALTWVQWALSFKPDAWEIWDTFGALYYKLGRKAEALSALQKALELARQAQQPPTLYEGTQALYEKAQALPD